MKVNVRLPQKRLGLRIKAFFGDLEGNATSAYQNSNFTWIYNIEYLSSIPALHKIPVLLNIVSENVRETPLRCL